MTFTNDGKYNTLSTIADTIFNRCNDDPSCIAKEIRKLDEETRHDILSSDLLNAWQVFWYYFHEYPGEEGEEFLMFHSAGELSRGVPMGELDIFTITFFVINGEPEIRIADDLHEVAGFTGSSAWADTIKYIRQGGC
jgi:hypothetical protein